MWRSEFAMCFCFFVSVRRPNAGWLWLILPDGPHSVLFCVAKIGIFLQNESFWFIFFDFCLLSLVGESLGNIGFLLLNIRYFFLAKSIHSFTCGVFLAAFYGFWVWRVGFSTLHSRQLVSCCLSVSFHPVSGVKGCCIFLHHVFSCGVNTSECKPSHLKYLKISDKIPLCEGVNAFLGK